MSQILSSLLFLVVVIFLSKCFSISPISQNSAGEPLNLKFHQDFANVSTLQLVQVIFRHGDRTPLYPFPNDPNGNHDYGVKGLGQLTKIGKARAYELGQYLRARYDGYLGDHYEIDEVFTRSSSVFRTITTGELCLAGLFPVLENPQSMNWQPIPVFSISRELDNKIGFYKPCPMHLKLKNEFLMGLQQSHETGSNVKLLKLLQENSGIDKKLPIYKAAYQLADTFFVQKDNGLTIPDWTIGVFPDLVSNLTDSEFTFDTSTHELKKLYIGPLVSELVRKIHLKLGNLTLTEEDLEVSPIAKMYLYSGHDTTISNFLNSFELYDHEGPVYNSAVILELHEEQNFDGPILKLFYKKHRNEEIKKLQIPNCPDPCSLRRFESIYNEYIFSEQEWDVACSARA